MANEFTTTPSIAAIPSPESGSANIITAGSTVLDGCPVLTRLKAFVTAQGVPVTLSMIMRDSKGNPVNLSAIIDVSEASESHDVDSESADEGDGGDASVVLQVAEFDPDSSTTVISIVGKITDAAGGVIQAGLPYKIYQTAGIYTLTWTYLLHGVPQYSNNAILSVERNLLAPQIKLGKGPPTINEVRMAIMDSAAAENVLLDGVEFQDEQILLAMIKPINYFNETNPPLSQTFSTRNFPWREHWITGAIAQLHYFAAANYRRNVLMVNTGGVSIADKNKEQEYLRAAKLYDDQWKQFALSKKVQLNAAAFFGTYGSMYGR